MKTQHIIAILLSFSLFTVSVTNLQASSQPYISGHDINFGAGNKYYTQTDLYLAGPVAPLVFKRTYNSQSTETGILGYGWISSFSEKLIIGSDKIVFVQPGGRHVHFLNNGSGAWVNESGKTRTITTVTNGYLLAEPDGTLSRFGLSGLLLEKHTPGGYTLTLSHAGTLLSSLIDTFGRSLTFAYAGNRLQTLTTPVGTFQYGYDAYGNLTTVTRPDGTTRTYLYEDANDIHNLTGIIDETGTRTLTVAYDFDDRAVSSVFADGKNAVSIEYLPGLERKITDSVGVVSTYQLAVQNGVVRVASFTGPGCSACGSDTGSSYVYDARQLITQVTDAKGTVTSYTYDTQGNRVSRTEAVGVVEERTTIWTYNPGSDRVATVTKNSVSNPGQQVITTMTYDAQGNLTSRAESGFAGTTTPISRAMGYTYDTLSRITSIDGPRTDVNDTTSFAYYPNNPAEGLNRGFLKTITNTLGHVTTYSNYNAFGKTKRITPPYGSSIIMTHDAMGRLTSRTRGSISTTYQYYADGKIHIIQLPDARTITYTYTGSGKPETISDSLNNRITYTYDSQDNRIRQEIHDPDNILQYFVEYTYEETGDIDKIIQADASFVDMNYDSVGNLVTRINALNKSTEYRYDALNRLTVVVEPGVITTSYSYNSSDNLTKVTDAEGKQTIFTYDDFGRRTSRMSPDTGLTFFVYDSADNLITSTDSNNITTTYEYDSLNRLTAVHYPDLTRDVLYSYDGNGSTGLLTSTQDSSGSSSYQYDLYGRLTGASRKQGGKLFVTGYGYNDNNELTTITYPGGRVISYIRNTAGQITSVSSTFQGITTIVAYNIIYKPFGPREDMTLGNGITVDTGYNQLYRLTNTTAGTLYNRTYQYSATGHVQSITDTIDPASSQNFTYDDLGRLNAAQGKYGTYNWTYDAVGNRLSETSGTDITNYTYEPGKNRLSQVTTNQTAVNYSYDHAGNLLSRDNAGFNWSQNNRLLSAEINTTTVGEYGYDGRGLRTKRTANGKTISYVYDQAGNLLAEIDDAGSILQEFVYLDGTRLAVFDRTSAGIFIIAVTTASGLPVEGATISPYTEAGVAADIQATTDAQGSATFTQARLPEDNYQFRIRYLDIETWSPLVNVRYNSGIQVQLDMELKPVDISVVLGGTARPNAVVTVFSVTGEHLDMQGVTDSTGKVSFNLPVGRTYTFKVLYLASFYWSTPYTVAPDGGALVINDSLPAGNLPLPPILSLLLGQSLNIPASPPVLVPLAGAWNFNTYQAEDTLQEQSPTVSTYSFPPTTGAGVTLANTLQGSATTNMDEMQATTALTGTTANFAVYYYIPDHLGTAQLLVDESKEIVWQGNFTPFGTVDVVINTLEHNFRFPGQYFDEETGLHYNWHRYYDPETGRYITADPIGLAGGMNLYAYVLENPVNYIDPEGLWSIFTPYWNGNLKPGHNPFQDMVCTEPAPQDWNEEGCEEIKDCCKKHDECYKKNKCNETSWFTSTIPSSCSMCNIEAAICIILAPTDENVIY